MISRSDLVCDIVQAIVDSGYAVHYTLRCPWLHVPHVKHAARLAQLQMAQAWFEQQYGYAPCGWQLAIMCGVSETTVSRVRKAKK